MFFLAGDYLWLKTVVRNFYRKRLGGLVLDDPKLGIAAVFYAVFVVGIVLFCVDPAMRTGSATTAVVYGTLFGFFTYGTYDMTNYASIRGWSLAVTVLDIIWGSLITGLSALVGFLATRALL